jgi:hypothetical protein
MFRLTCKGGFNSDCLYVYVDLLGKEIKQGIMKGRKGKRHCRTSWFILEL